METFTPQEAPSLLGALRLYFFEADESKTVNCVSALALAQHLEAAIKRNQYST
jgi:hypothetical protein